jgi:hypothetical protein
MIFFSYRFNAYSREGLHYKLILLSFILLFVSVNMTFLTQFKQKRQKSLYINKLELSIYCKNPKKKENKIQDSLQKSGKMGRVLP